MKKPKRAKCKECEKLRSRLDELYGEVVTLQCRVSYLTRKADTRGKERDVFLRFFDDVNLILSGSRDTLCGSKWINAASLLEARNRYAKAMEEL